jgi:hypothetical protein
MSFLRHADLSPDGHLDPGKRKRKQQRLSFPPVTHRYDESGRVFLASCSPAELASAFSTAQVCQNFRNLSKE